MKPKYFETKKIFSTEVQAHLEFLKTTKKASFMLEKTNLF